MGIFVNYLTDVFVNVEKTSKILVTTTAHPLIINGLVVKNKTGNPLRFNLLQTRNLPSTTTYLLTEFEVLPYKTVNVIDTIGEIFLKYTAATSSNPVIFDSLICSTNALTQICDCTLSYTSLNDLPINDDITSITGIVAAIYMSSNATPTTAVTSTFKKATGATTSSFVSSNFTVASNRITYNGLDTIKSMISADISASHAVVAGAIIGLSIFKNGVKLSASNYNYQLTPDITNSLSVTVYASLSTADYIEVWVNLNTVTPTNMIVSDMNLSIII
jgi:hypothetical protein